MAAEVENAPQAPTLGDVEKPKEEKEQNTQNDSDRKSEDGCAAHLSHINASFAHPLAIAGRTRCDGDGNLEW